MMLKKKLRKRPNNYMIRKTALVYTLLLIGFSSYSQQKSVAKWVISTTDSTIVFNVDIDEGWQLYSSDFDPNLGPVVTTFEFNGGIPIEGEVKAIDPTRKYDDLWGGEYSYFKGDAQFVQKVDPKKVTKEGLYGVDVNFQVCNENDGHCVLYNEKYEIYFK